MNDRFKKILMPFLRVFPFLYYIVFITNRYAWGSDYPGSSKIVAPANLWLRRIGAPLFGAAIMFFLGDKYVSDFYVNVSSMIVDTYPSILGFAIGLYSIVVAGSSFQKLRENISTIGKAMRISVDMAFPLIIMLTTLIGNSLLVSADANKCFYAGVINIYSIYVLYDMLASVYSTSLSK